MWGLSCLSPYAEMETTMETELKDILSLIIIFQILLMAMFTPLLQAETSILYSNKGFMRTVPFATNLNYSFFEKMGNREYQIFVAKGGEETDI